MVEVTRRQTLALGAGAFLTELLAGGAVRAAAKDTLTIAYNVNLPSFDPTDGPSAVNPTIQAIYRSIFDQYIGQAPDLTLKPGILTAWGWNDDKSKLWMDVRPDVKWQDGSPLTPEDVVWSLERAGAKDSANQRKEGSPSDLCSAIGACIRAFADLVAAVFAQPEFGVDNLDGRLRQFRRGKWG